MQPNVITLSVDAANDGNPADEQLDRYSEEVNKSTYHLPGHTDAARNMCQLYRSTPKVNGQSRGVSRALVKFTKDQSVPNADGSGDIVLPLITEVSIAVPVGTTDAEVIHSLQRVISFADSSEGESLFTSREI